MTLRQREARRRRHRRHREAHVLLRRLKTVGKEGPALRARAVGHDRGLHLRGDRLMTLAARLVHDAEIARVGEHLRMGLLRIGRRRIASVARRARERLLGVRVVDAAVTCRAILAVRCRSGRRGEAEDRQHERYDHCPGCHCQSSMRHPRYVSTSVYASLTTPLTPRASRVEETAALHCPGATVDPWIVDSRHVTSGSLM